MATHPFSRKIPRVVGEQNVRSGAKRSCKYVAVFRVDLYIVRNNESVHRAFEFRIGKKLIHELFKTASGEFIEADGGTEVT